MNGTFDKNGHISKIGFQALTSGKAGELTRLELAEHLDWCDLCVDRYSLLMTDDILMDAPEQLSESVMANIRRRAIAFFTGQAAKVCAAACLTIIIWCGGIFNGNIMAQGEAFSEKVAAGGISFSQSVFRFGDAIENWLGGLSINVRGVEHGTEE
ncbi:MAG: hypothetical protein IJD13_00425 [Oscillospiraceae bacterium]|nr:hypothetical protein [Oscillospiraceae bacterium]